MFGKIRGAADDSIDEVVAGLGGKFRQLLDDVLLERLKTTSGEQPPRDDPSDVIARYSRLNQGVAAASALLPGPLGILAGAGELVVVTGNQMRMICDLGRTFDKESVLTKGMMIDIPLQAMGVPGDLDSLQSLRENPGEAASEMLRSRSTQYARVIAVKNLKKSLVKFVPVGGGLLMAVWTKKSTKKIGQVAESFLDDAKVLEPVSPANAFSENEPEELLVERIKVLATMMEQNGEIKDKELAFLVPIITNAQLDEPAQLQLLEEAKRIGSHFKIDYAAIAEKPDLADDLLSDLIVLARRDGEVGPNELAYLKEVASLLGVSEEDALDLLDI